MKACQQAAAVAVMILSPAALVLAQDGLNRIKTTSGGVLVYGTVNGVATNPQAMAQILRNVHQNCGEKPMVGKLFRFKATDMVGAYFSVTNHAGGNVPVAGLVLTATTGPQHVEAALVSAKADRFGQTEQSMLKQLFAAWHPSGQGIGASSDQRANAQNAMPLRMLESSDHTVRVGVPQGWMLAPDTGGGTAIIKGPHEEVIALNAEDLAQDPRNRGVQATMAIEQQSGKGSQNLYLRYGENLPESFARVVNHIRAKSGAQPVRIQVTSAHPTPEKQCAVLEGVGHDSSAGKDKNFLGVFCEEMQGSGMWLAEINMAFLPVADTAAERPTAEAVLRSFQLNQQAMDALLATARAQHQQNMRQLNAQLQRSQQQLQGAFNDFQESLQHRQDSFDRNIQNFDYFIRDQQVLQVNGLDSSGTIGHATVSNQEADALVKSNPDRYEYVNPQGYWKGIDY